MFLYGSIENLQLKIWFCKLVLILIKGISCIWNYDDYKGRCIEMCIYKLWGLQKSLYRKCHMKHVEASLLSPLAFMHQILSTMRPEVWFLQLTASLWKNHVFLLPYLTQFYWDFQYQSISFCDRNLLYSWCKLI